VKKKLSYLLTAVMLLSVLVAGPAVGPYGIDAVSAATGDAAAPAGGAKASSSGNVLVEGSFGDAVKNLQNALVSAGYSLKADGFFGAKTKEAVMDYQKKNGLKADGIVGASTLAKLGLATAAAPAAPAPAAPAAEKRAQGIYPDVVATASVNLTSEAQLANSLGANGTWITTLGANTEAKNDLVWVGDIRKDEKTVGRKLGIYYHSSPNIGGEQIFTLKVPNLIVKAENANIAYGVLDGNVKVQAKGFNLTYATITGNLYFDTQEQYASSKYNDMVIKGDVYVAGQKLDSKMKPQTITNYAKYDENPTKSDMMKAAVTFKDGKAHDVFIDVLGHSYYIPQGVLSSGGQGNFGKVAYSKAGQYVMVKPSEDRPASTILAWDKQITEVIKLYKSTGYDLSQIPTFQRDASHPSVLDFNKLLDGKYKAYTKSETEGTIDWAKLKGVEKVDAITSCSVDVGKYLKLADSIIKAGVK
jgi:peptidoglycan hydrolase-like protein with peptidoglycan-binding domain